MAQQQQHQPQQLSNQVAKTTAAVTLTGALMLLSSLTLATTVIGLVIATPVLVIFSPILIPAAITIFVLLAGMFTAGGLGATATFVLTWMYRYVTGKHPIGTDQLNMLKEKLVGSAEGIKEKTEQIGHDNSKGVMVQQQQPGDQQLSHPVAKTATAITVAASLIVLSSLTLSATVSSLVLATPVLVIFSPVLVPAVITASLLLPRLVTSGGLGTTATFALTQVYQYTTRNCTNLLAELKAKVTGVVEGVKARVEQLFVQRNY